jgi:prepilin-type processing-associated H-X9-DG protein
MLIHADRDPATRYCTGAWDAFRDGSPDVWGWVADLVNLGICEPGQLMDPASPMNGPEKWNEIVQGFSGVTANGKDGCPTSRYADGVGPKLTNAADDAARADIAARFLLDKGYNTNYAAGWHLVRGGPKVTGNNASPVEIIWDTSAGGASTAKGLGCTRGPLTMKIVENSLVPASNIGLLGCGGPGDPDEAFMTLTLYSSVTDTTYIDQGERLCEAFNDGPAQVDPAGGVKIPKNEQVDLTAQMIAEQDPDNPPGAPEVGTGYFVQDTRDWFALHNGTVNILMADGSVKQFTDQNNDMYLNPGFEIPGTWTEDQYQKTGYRPGPVEMPPQEIFNGVFLEDMQTGKAQAFEDSY